LEANTRNLARLFDHTIQYQVPLFQRPYVWTQESNLTALWEDVQARLDKQLRSMKVHPHFLGAIVLEQLANLLDRSKAARSSMGSSAARLCSCS
jgi:uncharacterized protein with ParB-like and HNH nuclease domain